MANTTVHITGEQHLAKLCGKGDRVAQKKLYDEYAEYLLLVAYRYIPGEHDAREVLMDALLSAYKNIDRFTWQGEGSLRAWLKKIVVNQALMFLRKKNRQLLQMDDVIAEEVATDTDALHKLSVKELMNIIHRLPDGYRTVFNLYVFEGMTHKEIGRLLDISENTSKSQLHKAKSMLQEHIRLTYKYNTYER